jgi:hypothetical protein
VNPQTAPDDPLEQDAIRPGPDDVVVPAWFLREDERANRETDLRMFSTGNAVTPLVDGATYFARLCAELGRTRAGDQVYFLDFAATWKSGWTSSPALRSDACSPTPPSAESGRQPPPEARRDQASRQTGRRCRIRRRHRFGARPPG